MVNSDFGFGRFPEGGHGNPLQHSCLENPHGQRSLWATVQGHKESDMTEQLSMAQTIEYDSPRDEEELESGALQP